MHASVTFSELKNELALWTDLFCSRQRLIFGHSPKDDRRKVDYDIETWNSVYTFINAAKNYSLPLSDVHTYLISSLVLQDTTSIANLATVGQAILMGTGVLFVLWVIRALLWMLLSMYTGPIKSCFNSSVRMLVSPIWWPPWCSNCILIRDPRYQTKLNRALTN